MPKNRFAILIAFLTLLVIVAGACLTSSIRPMPGAAESTPGVDPGFEHVHRIGGYLVAALTFALAVWAPSLPAWLALGVVVIEALSGGSALLHALLAPVLLSALTAAAVVTSPAWLASPPKLVCNWKPLNILCLVMPVLVVMQIGLGAAYRHQSMVSPISHIMNAFIVLTVLLIVGVFVMRQYPDHSELRPAALWLLILAGLQVLLGFTVYLVLLISQENNMGLIVTGVLHVANGALTLAATVVLAMQIRRNLIQSSGVK